MYKIPYGPNIFSSLRYIYMPMNGIAEKSTSFNMGKADSTEPVFFISEVYLQVSIVNIHNYSDFSRCSLGYRVIINRLQSFNCLYLIQRHRLEFLQLNLLKSYPSTILYLWARENIQLLQ